MQPQSAESVEKKLSGYRPRKNCLVSDVFPATITWGILWTVANVLGGPFFFGFAYLGFGIMAGAVRQPYVAEFTPVMMVFGTFGFLTGCLCGGLVHFCAFIFGMRRGPGGWAGYGGLAGLIGWWGGVTLMALGLLGPWNSFPAWYWVIVVAIGFGCIIMWITSFWGEALFSAIGAFGHPIIASILLLVAMRILLSALSTGPHEEPPVWGPTIMLDETSQEINLNEY